MKLKQIRNTTLLVIYAGKKFLIDPTFELPVPVEELLDVDAVIITHMHSNYYHPCSLDLFPHHIKLFVQNEVEVETLERMGFTDVNLLKEHGTLFDGIWVIKTPATPSHELHSPDYSLEHETCGVILNHLHEKSLYIMGNTLISDPIDEILTDVSPDVIVANYGPIKHIDNRYLVMNKEKLLHILKSTIESRLLASYIKPSIKNLASEIALRDYSVESGYSDRLTMLTDGLTLDI